MISKTELRKLLTEKRKTLDTAGLSKIICEKIRENEIYKSSKNIFAYYPLSYEVDIKPLFDDNKNWFLPKVEGNDLEFYEYHNGDELKKGAFGVFEPIYDEKTAIIPDLIIVPALSVDKNKYRMGYGKGYYDRFLNSLNPCPTVLCPIFSDLVAETLPIESHDKKVDVVLTD